jgi:hypothetical protein
MEQSPSHRPLCGISEAEKSTQRGVEEHFFDRFVIDSIGNVLIFRALKGAQKKSVHQNDIYK